MKSTYFINQKWGNYVYLFLMKNGEIILVEVYLRDLQKPYVHCVLVSSSVQSMYTFEKISIPWCLEFL